MARQVPAEVEVIRAEMGVRPLQNMNLCKTRSPIISSRQFEVEVADRRVDTLALHLELIHYASLKWFSGNIIKDVRLYRIHPSYVLRV
ncbi:hypothetical protein ACFX13_030224 [Malus domestica]